MKPPSRRLLLWLALPVLLMAVAVWSWTPREPSWEGRSLSSWLEDLETDTRGKLGAVGEQNAEAAERAIQGMGTNCLPSLLRRLGQLKPSPLEKKLIRLEQQLRTHEVSVPWDSTENRLILQWDALHSAFKALGHAAAPLVPELERWLASSVEEKAGAAAQVLALIHPEGTAALVRASTNRTIASRFIILVMLDQLTPQHPEMLAAILRMADDPDAHIRGHLGHTLSKYESEAASVLPVLVRLLGDTDHLVRQSALIGLYQFKGDVRAAESALTALIANPGVKHSIAEQGLLKKIKAQSVTPPPLTPAPP
ncbi:MAG: hypothetical protein RL514_4372 [Verrucomicrobiota bacterium]|jgi:hypothetical protein